MASVRIEFLGSAPDEDLYRICLQGRDDRGVPFYHPLTLTSVEFATVLNAGCQIHDLIVSGQRVTLAVPSHVEAGQPLREPIIVEKPAGGRGLERIPNQDTI